MELFQIATRIGRKRQTLDLDLLTITEFGNTCSPEYWNDGLFNKWWYDCYVVSNGNTYNCSYHKMTDLKKEFEGRFTGKIKQTLIGQRYKKGQYIGERKGIEWVYTIKTAL